MRIGLLPGGVTVSDQIGLEDLASLAARGVRVVVCNRPDDEPPVHLRAAEAAGQARGLGIELVAMPFTFETLRPEDVNDFAALLAVAPGAVHAYCRSGNRSASLWALARLQMGEETDMVRAALEGAGYTTEAALTWRAQRG